MYELSFVELESELSAELPTRNLMSRRRRHMGGNSAWANNGSGSNSASQSATVVPVQTAFANNGDAKNEIKDGIRVSQSLTQQNTPVNLALG